MQLSDYFADVPLVVGVNDLRAQPALEEYSAALHQVNETEGVTMRNLRRLSSAKYRLDCAQQLLGCEDLIVKQQNGRFAARLYNLNISQLPINKKGIKYV